MAACTRDSVTRAGLFLDHARASHLRTDSWAQAIGKDLSVIAGAFGLIALVLLFSGRFALRAFRRVEQSDRDQRELNSQLAAARDQLEQAAKRVRMIAGSLPALVASIDADERYVFHNSYHGNIPGIDPARLTGRTMREVRGDALYAAISDQIHAVLNGTPVHVERTMQVDALVRHLKFDYFGRRLRACVRETDLAARLAGDEFVIVLEGLGQPAASRTVAAKIIAAMRLPFLVEGTTLAVSTSVGSAISDAIDEDVDFLLKKADTELYQAKRDGRGGFRA